MRLCSQRQVRAVAGRRPVPGPNAALHHVRQRAAHHARGLHRQDHGVLDLHMSRPGPRRSMNSSYRVTLSRVAARLPRRADVCAVRSAAGRRATHKPSQLSFVCKLSSSRRRRLSGNDYVSIQFITVRRCLRELL